MRPDFKKLAARLRKSNENHDAQGRFSAGEGFKTGGYSPAGVFQHHLDTEQGHYMVTHMQGGASWSKDEKTRGDHKKYPGSVQVEFTPHGSDNAKTIYRSGKIKDPSQMSGHLHAARATLDRHRSSFGKSNENHDEHGRFSSGEGGGGSRLAHTKEEVRAGVNRSNQARRDAATRHNEGTKELRAKMDRVQEARGKQPLTIQRIDSAMGSDASSTFHFSQGGKHIGSIESDRFGHKVFGRGDASSHRTLREALDRFSLGHRSKEIGSLRQGKHFNKYNSNHGEGGRFSAGEGGGNHLKIVGLNDRMQANAKAANEMLHHSFHVGAALRSGDRRRADFHRGEIKRLQGEMRSRNSSQRASHRGSNYTPMGHHIGH